MSEQTKKLNTDNISGFLLDLTIALREGRINLSRIEIQIEGDGADILKELSDYAKESEDTIVKDASKKLNVIWSTKKRTAISGGLG